MNIAIVTLAALLCILIGCYIGINLRDSELKDAKDKIRRMKLMLNEHYGSSTPQKPLQNAKPLYVTYWDQRVKRHRKIMFLRVRGSVSDKCIKFMRESMQRRSGGDLDIFIIDDKTDIMTEAGWR